ncbi:MAG: FAD-binding protein [Bacteroidales bacterium]|nr:FAD-binding protein [Bacteroidales bacterium]
MIPGVERAIPIAALSTLRVRGGTAQVATPQTVEQLRNWIEHCQQIGRPFRLLGRGSNTLIQTAPSLILRTTRLNRVEIQGDRVRAEAGVSLQRLIRQCQRQGLGGWEFLISVPGTVGGALVMNAGRGTRAPQECLGHFVESVTIWDGWVCRPLTAHDCAFHFRDSLFQRRNRVVLAATLRAIRRAPEEIEYRMHQRLRHIQRTQDCTHPNLGSVFRSGYRAAIGRCMSPVGGAAWSTRTPNWIVNPGGATAHAVWELIERTVEEHENRGFLPPIREIIIW